MTRWEALVAVLLVVGMLGLMALQLPCLGYQPIPEQGVALENNVRVYPPQMTNGRGVILKDGVVYPMYSWGTLTNFEIGGQKFTLFTGNAWIPALLAFSEVTEHRWVNNAKAEGIGLWEGKPSYLSPETKNNYVVSVRCGGLKINP